MVVNVREVRCQVLVVEPDTRMIGSPKKMRLFTSVGTEGFREGSGVTPACYTETSSSCSKQVTGLYFLLTTEGVHLPPQKLVWPLSLPSGFLISLYVDLLLNAKPP